MPANEYSAAQYGLGFLVSSAGGTRDEFQWSEAGFAQAQREIASWDGVPCPCTLCESGQGADNVTEELVALVRQGDEAGFRELAACVMPAGEVEECWAGARGRLGLGDIP